jgi:hypothetical protein
MEDSEVAGIWKPDIVAAELQSRLSEAQIKLQTTVEEEARFNSSVSTFGA